MITTSEILSSKILFRSISFLEGRRVLGIVIVLGFIVTKVEKQYKDLDYALSIVFGFSEVPRILIMIPPFSASNHILDTRFVYVPCRRSCNNISMNCYQALEMLNQTFLLVHPSIPFFPSFSFSYSNLAL